MKQDDDSDCGGEPKDKLQIDDVGGWHGINLFRSEYETQSHVNGLFEILSHVDNNGH
jgi:hypothetical protein